MTTLAPVSQIEPEAPIVAAIPTAVPATKRARRTKIPALHPTPPAAAQIKPWPTVTAKDETKLLYPIGIELTMIPPVIKSGTSTDSTIVQNYARIAQTLFDQRSIPTYSDPHRDQFAVEVPSKVLKTWGTVKEFYDKAAGTLLEIGLMPHHPKITSGGGHIHVGPIKEMLALNIIRDMQNRPWLTWTFNEPDDGTTACTFTKSLNGLSDTVRAAATNVNVDPGLFCDDLNEDAQIALVFYGNPKFVSSDWLPSSKGKMLRYIARHKTLEFRMFEAPANWQEQEAHIRFIESYIAWVEATYKKSPATVTIDRLEQLKSMTEESCRMEFVKFLEILGLPAAPYQRMLDQNLAYRFKKGERV